MKRLVVVGLVSMGLFPGTAAASPTGTLAITGVSPPASQYASSTVTGTASVNDNCGPTCNWFATVDVVDAAQPCNSSSPHWVGPNEFSAASNTYAVSWMVYQAGPRQERACLYVWDTGHYNLVAEAIYDGPPVPATPAPPTPTPTYTPPSGSTPPASTASGFMSASDARYYTRHAIFRNTGRSPHIATYGCSRLTNSMFRCRPAWFDSRNVYAGTLTMRDQGATIRYGFVGLRASRNCLGRHRVSACVVSARWGVSPTTPSYPAPSSPPTTINFGNGHGAIGLCRDGTLSDSIGRQGACSHHGGVAP
jgi:hypothetical protein